MNLLLIFAIFVLPKFILSIPLQNEEALVMVTDKPSTNVQKVETAEPQPPRLKSMNVISNVRNRYGRTVIITKYLNPNSKSQETTFSVVLPEKAFLSGFVMEINDKKYEAYVQEKEDAKRDYDAAAERGESAGHVAVSARDSNTFTVSVNVEALTNVTFNLTYEELLVRKHGKYEIVINLNPGQLVHDLDVNVHINETRKIVHVEAPAIRSRNEIKYTDTATRNEYATISNVNEKGTEVKVNFAPTIQIQKDIIKKQNNKDENLGMSGQFVVQYDVERDSEGGDVIVDDGYFVHFFAPTELQPIPKHVVFVLDDSSSMNGQKINQLKSAMSFILNELHEDDYFNVVKFHTIVHAWNETWQYTNDPQETTLPQPMPVNKDVINKSIVSINKINYDEWTNIYNALIVALRLTSQSLDNQENSKHKPQPIIVLLTDGQANVTETNSQNIIEKVQELNHDNTAAIFTLSFGHDTNKEFLRELAIKNNGFMRTIYADADASLQLQDFYKEISLSLLKNIKFVYADNKVKDVTKHNFNLLFNGSELVVASRIKNPKKKFISVVGLTHNDTVHHYPKIWPIIKHPETKQEYGSLERLWVYMTIKDLLNKNYEKEETNNTETVSPKKKALELALKYKFVTSLTSLVMVKPNQIEQTGKLINNKDEPTKERHNMHLSSPQYSNAGVQSLSLNRTTTVSLPMQNEEALVMVADEPSTNVQEVESAEPQPPKLKSMNVISNVRNRYGRTVIITKYINPNSKSQETTFSVVLPEKAFISGFVMEINDKKYEAYVKEKEDAKRDYDAAVERGESAGHVAVSARDSNTFTVSVNVEALTKVTFNLTYEELLVRKHGKYEMVINLNPGQLVDNLDVNVHINETRRIVHVEAPAIRSGNEIKNTDTATRNEYVTISNVNEEGTEVKVNFAPTIQIQKDIIKKQNNNDENLGMSGQFVVQYDVERDSEGGDVIVDDGYFVHFFAPTELKPIPKHVVFVLDDSGSMSGQKINQLKSAMSSILNELHEDDYFNVVKFHTVVHAWNETWQHINNPQETTLPQPMPVDKDVINKSLVSINKMNCNGMTNIYDALIVALRLTSKGLNDQENSKHKPQPIIVFLTDGQANVAETNYQNIIEKVQELNHDNTAAIFALSFGHDANKEFLKELAIKNNGFMRTIYADADASLQLQDFYKEISSALLKNIKFVYADNEVKDVTKHNFNLFFNGSELVVAGRIENPKENFISVVGSTHNNTFHHYPKIWPIIKHPEIKQEYGSLERLWVYMTIKDLLDKKYEKEESNDTETVSPKKKALNLALKYKFVTPLTSLVVVKPNQTEQTGKLINNEDKPIPIARTQYMLRVAPQASNWDIQHLSSNSRVGSVRRKMMRLSPQSPSSGTYDSLTLGAFPTVNSNFFPTVDSDVFDSLAPTITDATQNDYSELPWLQAIMTPANEILLDNNKYLLGDNSTTIDIKPCQVQSLNLSGNCTLISACPEIYSKLDSLDAYRPYFCTLDSNRYAGVCCPESST